MFARQLFHMMALAAVVTGPSMLCAQSDLKEPAAFMLDDVEQKWYGAVETGGPTLRLLIEAKKDDPGGFEATIFSLDQGNAEIPVERFELKDGKLEMDVPKVQGSYVGTLNDQGTVSKGTWTQMGQDMPLRLERVAEVPKLQVKELWQGTLATGQVNLEVQFRIVETADGKQQVLFDSLTQRANGFQATRKATDAGVQFEVPAVNGRFEGTFNEDKTAIDGIWTQMGNEMPLKLQRTEPTDDAAAAKPRKRPQHPQEPVPYESESIAFTNSGAQLCLAGTLTLPTGEGPFPAVVLVSGSGPQDRDETLMGHKPFLVIADHLTRAGIAVLRFDDRGVGASEGVFATATTADFATDAAAAVDFLKRDPRIDADRIGVIGHSEGGIVAGMLAAQLDELAHVVMLAGTGIPGDEVITSQTAAIFEAMGFGGEGSETAADSINAGNSSIDGTLEAIARLTSAIKTDATQAELDAIVEEYATQNEPSEGMSEKAIELRAAATRVQLKRLATPGIKFFIKHDPRVNLRMVKCPVLALNGDKDLQVLVDLNLPAIESALQESGISDYRCVRLEGLNHLFQQSETGVPMEYGVLEETFSPRALEVVTDWVLEH